jgi:hypothetical protein
MPKYRKKPVVIEAIRLTEDTCDEVHQFLDIPHDENGCGLEIYIETLEGTMCCDVGDWVIKGVKGEFYPCKNDIFEASYEPADPEHNDGVDRG